MLPVGQVVGSSMLSFLFSPGSQRRVTIVDRPFGQALVVLCECVVYDRDGIINKKQCTEARENRE